MITMEHVCKSYKVAKRDAGFREACKSLFHREYETIQALSDVSFTIGDFTYGQVLLCFAAVMMSFSLGELLGGRLSVFSGMLGDGSFDRALVRPQNLILQIVLPNLDFSRLGILAQAVIVLCIAIPASGVVWNWKKAVTLVLMVLCGAALFFGLFLVQGACAFFTVGNLNLSNFKSRTLENTGIFSVFGASALPFSLIFSLTGENKGKFFYTAPTTLSSSLAEVRLASLVAWA